MLGSYLPPSSCFACVRAQHSLQRMSPALHIHSPECSSCLGREQTWPGLVCWPSRYCRGPMHLQATDCIEGVTQAC